MMLAEMEFFRTKRAFAELEETERWPLALDAESALTRSRSSPRERRNWEAGALVHGRRYRIRGVLGSGGEGVVYRVHDYSQERDVALKVLHVSDASAVPLLKREFRFLRDLIHPALVQLHELVVDREGSFFTMSLVEGVDFLQAATDEPKLRDLLGQLAHVLCFLHSTGRVHRDIKSTNILVRPDGQLTLLDFGVGLNLSRPGMSLSGPTGTPRYMAPELLRGAPATPRCDAYSVGVLLYEALTGRHPQPSGKTELATHTTFYPRLVRGNVPRDLDALCAGLLEPDPNHRAHVDAIWDLTAPASGRSAVRHPTGSLDGDWFTGRAEELARLGECLARTRGGCQPIVVFVEAPSGLGKTAFLNRFLESRSEAVILRSRCSEHELVPHKAIDGIIEDLVEYLVARPTENILELVPPSEATILVQLFPELQRVPTLAQITPAGAPLGDSRALRMRAYLALAGVLGRLSDEVSLIVAIDDLQWGDLDSGNLLREVFAGPDRPNCLLLLSYRSEERHKSACLGRVLDGQFSLRAELLSTTVSLSPLPRREAHSLVTSLTREFPLSAELTERLLDEAEGSPLLLTELVTHLRDNSTELDAVSTGIDAIVQHRVSRLPEPLKRGFHLLCCSGTPLSLGLLSGLCDYEAEEILRRLSHLRLARMRRGGLEVEVFHDSMREATLRRLGQGAAQIHQLLADTLVARGGDEAQIARHYQACGNHAAASTWAEAAADRASRALALTQAVDLFRLALLEERRDEARAFRLRNKLAVALADAGRGAEAAPMFEYLAEHAEPSQAVALRRQAAEHYLICGQAERGVAMLARVQREVGLRWPETSREVLQVFLWERLRLKLRLKTRPALHSPSSPQLEQQLEACRAGWMVGFVSTIAASASASRYLRLAQDSGDPKHLARGFGMEAIYRATAGASQREFVHSLQARARSYMTEPLEGFAHAFYLFVEAQCLFTLGDTQRCPAAFEHAERALLEHCRNVSWELNSCRIFWSQSLWLLGRLAEWGRRLSSWIADAEDRGDMCLWSAARIGQGRRSIVVDGNREDAAAQVREGIARWNSPHGSVHFFMERFAYAFIAACSGDPAATLEETARIRAQMRAAHMDRVQVPRVHLHMAVGFAEVEMAADCKQPHLRKEHLSRALAAASALEKEGAKWATAFGSQIRASAQLVAAPSEPALARLKAAADLMEQLGFRLHHAAIQARVGELLGGEEGQELVSEAHAAFADAGAFDWVTALSGYTPRVLPR